jgi:hypothetical protein
MKSIAITPIEGYPPSLPAGQVDAVTVLFSGKSLRAAARKLGPEGFTDALIGLRAILMSDETQDELRLAAAEFVLRHSFEPAARRSGGKRKHRSV